MKPFSLEIHFRASRAKDYSSVLKSARLFSDFTENPNILRITDIEEAFIRWEDFTRVLIRTTQWAGTTVLYDGKPLMPFKNSFFYALQELMQCRRQYKESPDKKSFCAGADWGCYKLKCMGRYFDSYYSTYMRNPWYNYGYFIDAKTWAIDKDKIYEILSEDARLTLSENCPMYDPKRIKTFVAKLPDEIKIGGNWEIDVKMDIGSTGLIPVPKGIKFVLEPTSEPVQTQKAEDDFLEPGSDEYLDRILEERERNRKDDYSDLL